MSDFGDPSSWDPHTLKPSLLDEGASDGDIEVEEDLIGGASEVAEAMVEMLVGLKDNDPRDLDWLPPKQRWMLTARKRKQGVISPVLMHGVYGYSP